MKKTDNNAKNAIFVDFDDTLCLHQCDNSPTLDFAFAKPTIANVKKCYSHSEANHRLIKFLTSKKHEGYKLIMLSSASSKMLELKKVWCDIYCPKLFDDYISTCASEGLTKADYIKLYAKVNKLNVKKQIFIDDKSLERWDVEKLGCKTYSPQLIQNMD